MNQQGWGPQPGWGPQQGWGPQPGFQPPPYRPPVQPRPPTNNGRIAAYAGIGLLCLIMGLPVLIGLGRTSIAVRILAPILGLTLIAASVAERSRTGGPRTIVGRELAVALMLGATLVFGGGLGFLAHSNDVRECRTTLEQFSSPDAFKNELGTNTEVSVIRRRLEDMGTRVDVASSACERAKMHDEAEHLVAVKAALEKTRAEIVASPAAFATTSLTDAAPTTAPAGTTRDCPRGRVLIGANRTMIRCTECPSGKVAVTGTGDVIGCAPTTDDAGPSWLKTLAAIATNPKAIKPKKTEHESGGQVHGERIDPSDEYSYDLAPFESVSLSVNGRNKGAWTINLKAPKGFDAAELGPANAVRKLCGPDSLAHIIHYRIDSGPLHDTLVLTQPQSLNDTDGPVAVVIGSRTAYQEDVDRAVAGGQLERPASLEDFVCGR